MTKNVVLGIMALVMLTLTIFAYIKASDAQKASMEAQQSREVIIELQEEVEIQAELSSISAAEAIEAKAETEQMRLELLECRGE